MNGKQKRVQDQNSVQNIHSNTIFDVRRKTTINSEDLYGNAIVHNNSRNSSLNTNHKWQQSNTTKRNAAIQHAKDMAKKRIELMKPTELCTIVEKTNANVVRPKVNTNRIKSGANLEKTKQKVDTVKPNAPKKQETKVSTISLKPKSAETKTNRLAKTIHIDLTSVPSQKYTSLLNQKVNKPSTRSTSQVSTSLQKSKINVVTLPASQLSVQKATQTNTRPNTQGVKLNNKQVIDFKREKSAQPKAR